MCKLLKWVAKENLQFILRGEKEIRGVTRIYFIRLSRRARDVQFFKATFYESEEVSRHQAGTRHQTKNKIIKPTELLTCFILLINNAALA